jgi:hypothetical protein
MSQTDKYGLANLNATQSEADRITAQATTIAWSQEASTDRGSKHLQSTLGDNFARLSAQGENGFYRTGVAVGGVDKQVVQSEMGIERGFTTGFARLSEQHCETKGVIAAYGNRSSDQHAAASRELHSIGKDLALQNATHYGSLQLEASRNSKESLLEQSKWFALAEKTAMVNKCELAAKLAECCCEIKGVVLSTANATQSLIQAGEATRVRDALSAATTENAILRLRREEHHHYPVYHHGGGGGGDGPRRGSRS